MDNKILVKELAKKYNVTEEDINYILSKYDSIDNFYHIMTNYRETRITSEEKKLGRKIIKELIDIDDNPNKNYKDFFMNGFDLKNNRYINLYVYSSKKLNEAMDLLPEKERITIQKRYGLIDGEEWKTYKDVAKDINCNANTVSNNTAKACNDLYNLYWELYVINSFETEYLTDEELDRYMKIKKDIQLQNGNEKDNIEMLKPIVQQARDRKAKKLNNFKSLFSDTERKYLRSINVKSVNDLYSITDEDLNNLRGAGVKKKTVKFIRDKIEKYKVLFKDQLEQKEQNQKSKNENKEKVENDNIEDLYIDEVKFPTRIYTILYWEGIRLLSDLSNMTAKQLMNVEGIGKKSYAEIVAKMSEYGISFKVDEEYDKQYIKNIKRNKKGNTKAERMKIENVGLLSSSYDCLKKAGIDSLTDLSNITEKQLRNIRNLKKTYADTIISEMEKHGISLKEDDKNEKRVKSKEQIEQREKRKEIKNKKYVKKLEKEIESLIEERDSISERIDELVSKKEELTKGKEDN